MVVGLVDLSGPPRDFSVVAPGLLSQIDGFFTTTIHDHFSEETMIAFSAFNGHDPCLP